MVKQPIWLNSNIKSGNRLFYNENAIELGITLIAQILDDNGKFINFRQLQQISHNTISFIEYYSIIESIQISWYRMLRDDYVLGSPSPHWLNEILVSKKISSLMYNQLILREDVTVHKTQEWECNLGINL